MTFREEAVRAAGAMLEHPKEDGFYFVMRETRAAEGEVSLFPEDEADFEHASLELHGLSREQTVRVLRVLSLGRIADSYLERAIAEGAGY
jgi:hypothetical protein